MKLFRRKEKHPSDTIAGASVDMTGPWGGPLSQLASLQEECPVLFGELDTDKGGAASVATLDRDEIHVSSSSKAVPLGRFYNSYAVKRINLKEESPEEDGFDTGSSHNSNNNSGASKEKESRRRARQDLATLTLDHDPGYFCIKHISKKLYKQGRHTTHANSNKETAAGISEPSLLSQAILNLLVEAKYLSQFNHPNIIQLKGQADVQTLMMNEQQQQQQQHDSFFILTDRVQETLVDRLEGWRQERAKDSLLHAVSPSCPRFTTKLQYLRDIVSALDYLHSQQIMVLSLDPSKIGFLANSGRLQLCDLGTCREVIVNQQGNHPSENSQDGPHHDNHDNHAGVVEDESIRFGEDEIDDGEYFAPTIISPSASSEVDSSTQRRRSSLVVPGTEIGIVPRYMAPEIVTEGRVSLQADVYSWAMIALETLTLDVPFAQYKSGQYHVKVCLEGKRPNLSLYRELPSILEGLLKSAWRATVEKRVKCSKIHEIMERVVSRLEESKSNTVNCDLEGEDSNNLSFQDDSNQFEAPKRPTKKKLAKKKSKDSTMKDNSNESIRAEKRTSVKDDSDASNIEGKRSLMKDSSNTSNEGKGNRRASKRPSKESSIESSIKDTSNLNGDGKSVRRAKQKQLKEKSRDASDNNGKGARGEDPPVRRKGRKTAKGRSKSRGKSFRQDSNESTKQKDRRNSQDSQTKSVVLHKRGQMAGKRSQSMRNLSVQVNLASRSRPRLRKANSARATVSDTLPLQQHKSKNGKGAVIDKDEAVVSNTSQKIESALASNGDPTPQTGESPADNATEPTIYAEGLVLRSPEETKAELNDAPCVVETGLLGTAKEINESCATNEEAAEKLESLPPRKRSEGDHVAEKSEQFEENDAFLSNSSAHEPTGTKRNPTGHTPKKSKSKSSSRRGTRKEGNMVQGPSSEKKAKSPDLEEGKRKGRQRSNSEAAPLVGLQSSREIEGKRMPSRSASSNQLLGRIRPARSASSSRMGQSMNGGTRRRRASSIGTDEDPYLSNDLFKTDRSESAHRASTRRSSTASAEKAKKKAAVKDSDRKGKANDYGDKDSIDPTDSTSKKGGFLGFGAKKQDSIKQDESVKRSVGRRSILSKTGQLSNRNILSAFSPVARKQRIKEMAQKAR